MFEKLPLTLNDFYISLMTETLSALKINRFTDNFDQERFPKQQYPNKGPGIFEPMQHTHAFNWFHENLGNIHQTYNLLSDEHSRRLFLHLVAYRLGGHLSVKIPLEFDLNSDNFRQYKVCERASRSKASVSGMFGNLQHYDFEYKGHYYVVDCLGMSTPLFRRQYYLEREDVSIAPEKGDYIVDGGACLGETTAAFSASAGEEGKIYAFDPVFDHLEVLYINRDQSPEQNITIMPFGLSDHNVDCAPIHLTHYNPGFNSTSQQVPLRSLDYLVDSGEIERVDFLKLDVEGAEMSVLRGALETISTFRPKLAISLYHQPDDLYSIPLYLHQKFPFYEFFIGHYTIHSEETVLYAISGH